MPRSLRVLPIIVLTISTATAENAPDPDKVKEVLAGTRTVANAAWWGFDPVDATDALQAAINSPAKRVVVPNMTRDWIVRPITLRSDLELVLEAGVVISAKRGEYRGRGDSVFTARDVSNLTIRGYGATVRMQKKDYIVGKALKDLDWHRWFGQYEKAEWRMCLALRGCSNVRVEGLTLRESGGDGIYIDGGSELPYCENVVIQNVVCDDNYRQGISIISAVGLRVENSEFNNTWGTPPSSGVDIEPDGPENRIRNIVFRNCSFTDNYGDGIEVFLPNLKEDSGPISILFDNCRVTSRHGPGIRITKIADDGPHGEVVLRNCVVENTLGYGIKVQDKSVDRAVVRFEDCVVRYAARNRDYAAAWAPIWLHLFRPELTQRFGDIEFNNCRVEDDFDRPFLVYEAEGEATTLHDLSGTIRVRNPHGIETDLGDTMQGMTLEVAAAD